MIEKLKTLGWFASRPAFWQHAMELGFRKFRTNYDSEQCAREATHWAQERSVSVADALRAIGIQGDGNPPQIPPALIDEATSLVKKSLVAMGGPGDLQLLHAAVDLSGAKRILETGVAYGWSSLAILSALEDRQDAKLVSVDMPYPKAGNDPYVGIAVPERMRLKWTLIRKPDRSGLVDAINEFHGRIDFCHYDSDKSWWGRQYAFPILWNALVPGGVFMIDDIQDNMAFARFMESKKVPFAVTSFEGKFVGIARKY